jgi:hypothetical protein
MMPELLRDLHPHTDGIVTWHGARWREMPAPDPAPRPDLAWMIPAAERKQQRMRGRFKFRFKRGEIRQRVIAGFRGQMATPRQIMDRTGLTIRETQQGIARLQMAGEVVKASDRKTGSGEYSYRLARARTGTEAAA